jgi:hypothetical protein
MQPRLNGQWSGTVWLRRARDEIATAAHRIRIEGMMEQLTERSAEICISEKPVGGRLCSTGSGKRIVQAAVREGESYLSGFTTIYLLASTSSANRLYAFLGVRFERSDL